MLATAGCHSDILEQLTGSGALGAGSHMEDRAVRAAAGAGHGARGGSQSPADPGGEEEGPDTGGSGGGS